MAKKWPKNVQKLWQKLWDPHVCMTGVYAAWLQRPQDAQQSSLRLELPFIISAGFEFVLLPYFGTTNNFLVPTTAAPAAKKVPLESLLARVHLASLPSVKSLTTADFFLSNWKHLNQCWCFVLGSHNAAVSSTLMLRLPRTFGVEGRATGAGSQNGPSLLPGLGSLSPTYYAYITETSPSSSTVIRLSGYL
jgi:hypothetical protein